MTTITIETEGQTPIVITVGNASSTTAERQPHLTHHQPLSISPPAPVSQTTPKVTWKNRLRSSVPGVALGVLAAIVIMNSRAPQIPTPMMPDSGSTMPQQPLLPPLSGGPIGIASPSGGYGSGGSERPRSVNETVRDTQRAISSDRMGMPPQEAGGQGGAQNQGGAPTAGVAPAIKGAPVVGMPQAAGSESRGKGDASPFGLEP
ncbi:hypothetical protein K6W37_14860 [Acetobacter senegalensis]|uniref:hypothetical protein n=1 Tax=Acetobacter senegalensis TaxID=446692 RepID=UPI001EDB2D3F|nr:hypothetical protein [Acetobacter senegalensis]MCG4255161.1 hypothetical protein [Acetobacter senegalensis]